MVDGGHPHLSKVLANRQALLQTIRAAGEAWGSQGAPPLQARVSILNREQVLHTLQATLCLGDDPTQYQTQVFSNPIPPLYLPSYVYTFDAQYSWRESPCHKPKV